MPNTSWKPTRPPHPDDARYVRPAWLPGGHLQTIHGARCIRPPSIAFSRQRTETPDGDFIDLDWLKPVDRSQSAGTRALLIFHGLEGSSLSPYAQSMAGYFHHRGWVVVVGHFRGCSGAPNRLVRAYHSGDADDIAFMVDTVLRTLPEASWHLAGVSLGGNAMLRYLATPDKRHPELQACAAISVPLDLTACGRHLSGSFLGRYLYTPQFLKTMKPKVAAKARRFPEAFDARRVARSATLMDFDDAYTAPVHGFQNVLDYWTRASSKPVLGHIQTPTLVLNALNDPFVPAWSLPTQDEASPAIRLHQPPEGGHVGFVTGRWPGNLSWLPRRLDLFFLKRC